MDRRSPISNVQDWTAESMEQFNEDPIAFVGAVVDQHDEAFSLTDGLFSSANMGRGEDSPLDSMNMYNSSWFPHTPTFSAGPSSSLLLAPGSFARRPYSPEMRIDSNNSPDIYTRTDLNDLHHTQELPHIRINTSVSSRSLPSAANDYGSSPYPMYHHSLAGSSSPSTAGFSASPYTPNSLTISPMTRVNVIDGAAHSSPVSPSFNGSYLPSNATLSTFRKSPYLSPHYSPAEEPLPSFDLVQLPPTPTVAPQANPPQHVSSVLELAYRFPDYDRIIPQRTYRPHTQSDRRRYVEEVVLEEPIMFFMQKPDGCGMPCRDALNCRFIRLVGRDDPMFINRGPSVSIRLMWPGYAPWSRQIPTRDFRTPPGPITRAKLAKNVSKTVQRFIEDMTNHAMEEDADIRWRVGPHCITIDDLELIGLQHVSMGSWQVHLRLRRH